MGTDPAGAENRPGSGFRESLQAGWRQRHGDTHVSASQAMPGGQRAAHGSFASQIFTEALQCAGRCPEHGGCRGEERATDPTSLKHSDEGDRL